MGEVLAVFSNATVLMGVCCNVCVSHYYLKRVLIVGHTKEEGREKGRREELLCTFRKSKPISGA